MTNPRKLRCALYTRKSSEEGLDQDFTSLDAQREACAAYVLTQRHEGWMPVSTRYDDGGYSDGTLNRPALQTLLADIDAGTIDLIVVYKIDRLTRSLSDFAKIVERLDARSASFVSVTQSFNTTTSMGRLTLNVLLSFAQFERELTGERIRDKIGALKKKGMWMGGFVPIGYDAIDRQLKVNPEEAKIVRHIFDLYRTHQNIADIQRTLAAEGLRSKQRPQAKGRGKGGATYSSGALHSVLRNPLYGGRVRHKGTTYPGQHEAIVSDALWQDVQQILEDRRTNAVHRVQGKHPLLGTLVDEDGRRYHAVHTTKGGRRYRYYVSRVTGRGATTSDVPRARLPADDLDTLVGERIGILLRSAGSLLDAISKAHDDARMREQIVRRARALTESATLTSYRSLLQAVRIRSASIDVVLDRNALRGALDATPSPTDDHDVTNAPSEILLSVASRLYKTGHALRLVLDNETGTPVSTKRDAKLIRLAARGRRWYTELTSGQAPSLRSIAKREGLPDAYVSRVLNGSLLAPDIVERILKGTQPVTLTVEALRTSPPMEWIEQRTRFGIAPK